MTGQIYIFELANLYVRLSRVYQYNCQTSQALLQMKKIRNEKKKISLEKIFKDADFSEQTVRPRFLFVQQTQSCWNAASSYFDRRRQKLESTCRETPFATTVLCIKANALLSFAADDISPVAASLQAREYHEEARWEEPSTMCLWGIFFRLSRIFPLELRVPLAIAFR